MYPKYLFMYLSDRSRDPCSELLMSLHQLTKSVKTDKQLTNWLSKSYGSIHCTTACQMEQNL